MSNSSSFKLATLLLLTSTISTTSISIANADGGSQKGFGGFFQRAFTGSLPTSTPSSSPSQSATTPVVTQPAAASSTPSLPSQPVSPIPAPRTETVYNAPDFNTFVNVFSRFGGSAKPKPESVQPKANACTSLQDGESSIIDSQKIPEDMRALDAKYKLSRTRDMKTGDTVYEAAINIQFTPKAGENASVIDAITETTKTCYAAADIVSAQGEHLHLRLATASDEGIPATQVTVNSNSSQRMVSEDAYDWSTQADCPTTLHESMHLLGLVDLYYEPTYKNAAGQLQWNCRATADDSLMDSLAFAEYASSGFVENQCGCTTAACSAILDKIDSVPSACPGGTDSDPFTIGMTQLDIDTDPAVQAKFQSEFAPLLKGQRTDQWVYRFLVPAQPTQKVLYPAEFRAITQPGCSSNTIYYQCSKNAYLTSTENGGSGCVNRPTICDQHGQWLE